MEPSFPSPLYFGKQRRWWLPYVLNYERALAGHPPLEHFEPSDKRWLTAAQMRARFGDVSDMWLWRRTRGAARQTASSPKAARAATHAE